MGPELAQIAVSEGLARSRRDLIVKLDAGFEELRKDAGAFDVDADAADDNLKELAEEARALGVELRRGKKSNGVAIKSEEEPVVSGSIERTPPAGVTKAKSIDELIAMLDDKATRIQAATELCDRGDPRAAAPVIAAAKKLSRAEAVRILGKSVKFGSAAAKPLIEGLQSSKAFLRHGCALALALLRSDDGAHAVIELLMSEPTEIWREIARAIGQIGPNALMPLASHVGRLGSDGVTAQITERVSWAMAHVGVRGGKPALEQMANGQSLMAPIAKQALNLTTNAARDEVRVRPGQATKDVTVNRAFSRRFFEALEADRPDVAQAALHDLDASGPLELEDSDLILDESDDEAELDESDLIQT
jgi:HEAT repeat protein